MERARLFHALTLLAISVVPASSTRTGKGLEIFNEMVFRSLDIYRDNCFRLDLAISTSPDLVLTYNIMLRVNSLSGILLFKYQVFNLGALLLYCR
jgi:hypothetical protein